MFWPILVLLSIPNAIVLYWEPHAQGYADRAACEARLPELEGSARVDIPFLARVRMLNGGVTPELVFSRECPDKPPQQFYYEMLHAPGPGGDT